jgi:hypothetical protein
MRPPKPLTPPQPPTHPTPPHPAQASAADAPAPALKRKVVIFEVQGGADKGPDGHRKDTVPIADALRRRGWDAEVLFYSDSERRALTARCLATADAFLMRVNPGAYADFTEHEFLAMGRELHAKGCHALQHPDVMLSYGAKDSLVKLRGLEVGLPDTACYYDTAEFEATFPRHLAQVRVGGLAAGRACGVAPAVAGERRH